MSRLLVATALVASLGAGCGDDEETSSTTSLDPWTCQRALSQLTDEGDLVMEIPSANATTCVIEFSAGDDTLEVLGFRPTGCPAEASILVHFSLTNDAEFHVDQSGTMGADNGGCIELADVP